ncbi:MAG TPA: hypothetical protein VMS65_14260 [Polyangiaceae bacterium]|nr:hypothetical protein [Polyangiaceae bacterium]
MSSFPDPLELKDLEGAEEDPSVFERITAVPGEVPNAPPDGTAGSDEAISGLHQRQDDELLPSFREALADDDLPPVLGGRAPVSTKMRSKSTQPSVPKPAPPADPWKETGIRKAYGAKRPVLELELDDIPSTRPPPGPSPDALEARLPHRATAVEPPPTVKAAPPRPPRTVEATPPGPPPVLEATLPERPPALEAQLPEWSLAEPSPVSQPQVSPAVLDMRDRYATGDFTGALGVAQSLLDTDPKHDEARRCHDRCTDVLSQMVLARLGSLSQAVRVAVPNDQIRWLSLDHRAGFLLSLVDGNSTIEEILDISGMPRLDALRILDGLLDQRVIALAHRR